MYRLTENFAFKNLTIEIALHSFLGLDKNLLCGNGGGATRELVEDAGFACVLLASEYSRAWM